MFRPRVAFPRGAGGRFVDFHFGLLGLPAFLPAGEWTSLSACGLFHRLLSLARLLFQAASLKLAVAVARFRWSFGRAPPTPPFDSGSSIVTDMGPQPSLQHGLDDVDASLAVKWIYYDG